MMISTPLFDYADLQTLSQQELVWLDLLGTRWSSTDPQYWLDTQAYAHWQKLGGNEWMKVEDDPRLQLSFLRGLVARGWAELEERKWWNTEAVFLQARGTRDGIDAYQRLRDACLDAYFAHRRNVANGVRR